MSIITRTLEVVPEEGDTIEQVRDKMQKSLTCFAEKHPEFNFGLQMNEERNTVTIKTINLNDHAN